MYLLSQLASYLFLTFLLGVGVGYGLWRTWGQREVVAKFNAAEMRLAAHLARWEKTAALRDNAIRHGEEEGLARASAEKRWEETARRELHEFEVRHAALLKDAEEAAVRKAEAAAEKKLDDLTKKMSYETSPSHSGLSGHNATGMGEREGGHEPMTPHPEVIRVTDFPTRTD